MTISFSKGAEKVADLADELEDEHEDATKDSIQTLHNSVRRHLTTNDSVARTELLRDIKYSPSVSEHPRTFTSHAVHLPDWSKYLEHGTGSRGATDSHRGSIPFPSPQGLPPFQPILTWVIAKNLQSTEYNTRYGLAAAIQETIGDEGTFPHPFIRPAWRGPRGKRNIISKNLAAMKHAVRRF